MVSRYHEQPSRSQPTVREPLASQVKILFITAEDRPADWLLAALAADPESNVQMQQAGTLAHGLACLRAEVFDAVLVEHDPRYQDTFATLSAIRTGSHDDQPVVVLGRQPAVEVSVSCYQAGGDAYLCLENTTTRLLLWEISRAIEHHQMSRENRDWEQSSDRRRQLEDDETGRLLEAQRAMLFSPDKEPGRDRSASCPGNSPSGRSQLSSLPVPLLDHYRELLRTYVIMGSGNLAREMEDLARRLVHQGAAAQQVMHVHLSIVEEMVAGLGKRSARHLMNRADLLVMEVMVHLVDHYRARVQGTCTESPAGSPGDSVVDLLE